MKNFLKVLGVMVALAFGAVATYAEDGQVIVEEHYTHGNLISHNEYGDKSAYEAKNNTAGNAAAPTPNNAPAPGDMPTKLGDSSYDNP